MRSSRRGLTLIEVVVTLAIIATVAAVALPALRDFGPALDAGPLEPAHRLLLQARTEALARGVEVELVLAPTSGRYRIRIRDGDGVEVREGVVPIAGATLGGPEERFRVRFGPTGIGRGDTLAARDSRLIVVGATGQILIEH